MASVEAILRRFATDEVSPADAAPSLQDVERASGRTDASRDTTAAFQDETAAGNAGAATPSLSEESDDEPAGGPKGEGKAKGRVFGQGKIEEIGKWVRCAP